MISLEEVRKEAVTAFKNAHETAHAGTLVNYPNHMVVDIEHQKDPFVSLELDLKDIERSAIGERDLLVPGKLYAYYYMRLGTGTSQATKYTDMLNTELGMSLIGALSFGAVIPIDIQTFPDWKGVMNVISFDVVAPVTC